MEHGRMEEDESGLAKAFCCELWREGDGDAEGLQNIRRSAAGGYGAVAVLGDERSGGCGDEGRAGGDIEGDGASAACAAGVDELIALFFCEWDGSGAGAHLFDEAGELRGEFAACGEGGEQGRGFDFGDFLVEDGGEGGAGFFAGEG